MKKSLLALAVLGAFAGSAFAQASSVTIFGKLDLGVGKAVGSADKGILEGAAGNGGTGGSRIAFRGYEDLGGGLGAVFAFEHRLNVDTGVPGDPGTAASALGTTATNGSFWNGFAFVGLRSASLGTLTLGRHYTSSFLGVQNQVDPFEGETVAALRNTGMLLGTFANPAGNGFAALATLPTYGALGRVRVNNSIKYDISMSGVSFSASVAEANPNVGSAVSLIPETKRPFSLSLSYAGGPLWVGVAHENPGTPTDKLTNIGARYKIGPVTLRGGYSVGTTSGFTAPTIPAGPAAALQPAVNALALTSARDAKAYLLGANIAVGAGDIRVGYAVAKVDAVGASPSVDLSKKIGIGYHHNLSKRTKLYADFARDSKVLTPAGDPEKTGYDFGIQHAF
jgi:predicted porin